MARPRKQQTLSAKIDIRLPPDTAAKWKASAAADGVPVSDWVRTRIDGASAVTTGRPQTRHITADPELIRAVARVGNNLNQIARAVNAGADIQLLSHLISIEQQLHQLIEVLPDAQ